VAICEHHAAEERVRTLSVLIKQIYGCEPTRVGQRVRERENLSTKVRDDLSGAVRRNQNVRLIRLLSVHNGSDKEVHAEVALASKIRDGANESHVGVAVTDKLIRLGVCWTLKTFHRTSDALCHIR
jgi:hypothetical protein